MGVITFNGVSSTTLHIEVAEPPAYVSPARSYESIAVPGRNGEVLLDNGYYENVTQDYTISVDGTESSYEAVTAAVMAWLRSASGYAILTDSYNPDVYRYACYDEETSMSNIFNLAGEAEISFNCMPQRFLIAGDTPIPINSGDVLTNPTQNIALPIIKINGIGTLTIENTNGTTYTIHVDSTILEGVTLDCENLNCYSSITHINQNNHVTGDFPKLHGGDNTITYSGFTSVIITPRWWIL